MDASVHEDGPADGRGDQRAGAPVAPPVLAVVDVSDTGRGDPAFHAVLDELSGRVVAAAGPVGFVARRVAAEQLGVGGLLAAVHGAAAVVITGGEDVDPALYGGADDYPGRGQHFRGADAAQIALVRWLVTAGVPTIGICRGMQVVNVALGGDLVQHLDGAEHVSTDGTGMVDHEVALEPGSAVATALGCTALTVRSSHHQAVGRLGAGLVVVGRAADGTPEALEHLSVPLLAVQWHPEDREATGTVLHDLLSAARSRSRTGAGLP
jgi:putative glutamine amidotransferase